MARKRTGKLCQHKGTKVYYQNYKGKRIYFSRDKKESRRKWLENLEAIEAGEPLPHGGPKQAKPKPVSDAPLTLRQGLDLYVEDRERRLGKPEQSLRKSNELLLLCCQGDLPISELTPEHFALFRRALDRQFVPSTVANRVGNTASAFNWLLKNQKIPHVPAYGSEFQRPSERTIAQSRHDTAREHGERYYKPEEIRKMLEVAETYLQRATILLGVNCGFGLEDCAALEESHITERRWYSAFRGKTAVKRDAMLWDVTVEAIDNFKKFERLQTTSNKVFGGLTGRHIGRRFADVPLMAHCKRKGVGFYGLRHSFETFAADAADQQAADWIAGHKEHGTARVYRGKASRQRIERVANIVYQAVFGEETVKAM